jgi:alpha-tubulin suppressor-like RCC1 family protein
VPFPPFSGHPVKIDGGIAFMCALMSTSLVYCWGRNDYGSLGVNSDLSNIGKHAMPDWKAVQLDPSVQST